MKKRVLSLILAAVMACGLLPRLALAVTVTEIVPPKYEKVENFHDGLAAVEFNGKWGFIDKAGKEVVPCKYNRVDDFSEGLAAVRVGDYETGYKWGFIDTTGKEVVPCKYWDVRNFSEGLAAVTLDDKWGFIDKTGKEVVPCKYDGVGYFSEGLAAVKLDGKLRFIDTTGKEVISCKYGSVDNFSEGLAAVRLDGKWGFIDTTGKEAVPCKYNRVDDFSEGLAAVQDENYNWGVIDKTGKVVVPCKYGYNGYVGTFSDGLAAVKIGDESDGNVQMGYIDKTGKEVVPLGKYREVRDFSEGLAAVCVGDWPNEKWGFVDTTGKEVVPCTLEYFGAGGVREFSEGLAAVRVGNFETSKYGFIDKAGKEVVPCKYDHVENFSDGLAAVMDENYKWGFIDKTGKEVVPLGKYDGVENFDQGLAAVRVGEHPNNKWGFLAIDGTTDTAATTAYASTQVVQVDGKPVTFNAYALKDANGNDTNYIKLRDVADVLSGSAAQFQVGWDGTISITTGQMYTPNGTENIRNFIGNQSYTVSTSPVTINGVTAHLEAITLTGADGGGYTYFKLRDLGAALGFNVTWSAETGITIDPNTPYNPNN